MRVDENYKVSVVLPAGAYFILEFKLQVNKVLIYQKTNCILNAPCNFSHI